MAFDTSNNHVSWEWPEAVTALCVQRWREGLSASQISKALWSEARVSKTRNAVIGKLHRLGLTGRKQQPTKSKHKRERVTPFRKPSRAKPTKPRPLHASPPLDSMRMLTLHELHPQQCRFITGDPRDDAHRYCGNDTETGASFCVGHKALCYVRTETPAEKLTGKTFKGMRF